MEPAADSINEDPADTTAGTAPIVSASEAAPRQGVGRCVCPFCGKIHSRAESACPQCKMENTAANRAAARAGAGPWYVLSAASPNSGGITWEALREMAGNGQITVRTVVRGPSTNQLWRFAGRTRGLSREFGLCYGCGQAIQRTTEICPECQRWQLPPADANALLDSSDERGAKPVFREVPVAEADGAITPDSSSLPASPRDSREILTPKELAAAFSLNYQPMRPPKRRLSLWRTVASVLSVAAILGVIVACTMPSWRDPISHWYARLKDSPGHQTVQTHHAMAISTTVKRPVRPGPVFDYPTGAGMPAPRHASGGSQYAASVYPPAAAPSDSAQPNAAPATTDVQASADSEQEIQLAMGLFTDAIDAESRDDYSAAVWYYQKIKEDIPKDDWPGGLEIRLAAAQRHLGKN